MNTENKLQPFFRGFRWSVPHQTSQALGLSLIASAFWVGTAFPALANQVVADHVPMATVFAEPGSGLHSRAGVSAVAPNIKWQSSAWSILRRLEAIPVPEFAQTAKGWEQEFGDPAKQALILLAGSQEGPGWTVAARERRERLRAVALEYVEEALVQNRRGWRDWVVSGLRGSEEAEELEFRLACLGLTSRLNHLAWGDAVGMNLLSMGNAGTDPASDATIPWEARLLHDQAQSVLFALYGVLFATREEFDKFPRLPESDQLRYADAFRRGAKREFALQVQLLENNAQWAESLLHSPDQKLRTLAVAQLMNAVADQSLPVGDVREVLLSRLPFETSGPVFDSILKGVSELALATGPKSPAVNDLRAKLVQWAPEVPGPLAPAILTAFERLPRNPDQGPTGDWQMSTTVLASLIHPRLRLDGDTTAQVLRAWSRVNAEVDVRALEGELKQTCEQRVLDLMVDPGEPERVRLAAAEALASANIGASAVQRVVAALHDPKSSTHLRMVSYPLISDAMGRLEWEQFDSEPLIESLLRDMQHADVDLSQRAVALAREGTVLDRLVVLERERGSVLPACLESLQASPALSIRQDLLQLIGDVSLSAPRPDLLAEHLADPRSEQWIWGEPGLTRRLGPIYLDLAGPGQGPLIFRAVSNWLNMHGASGSAVRSEAALEIAGGAFQLWLDLPETEAAALNLAQHRALCELSQRHLIAMPSSASALWARRMAPRWLQVHIPKVRQEADEPSQAFYHLEALLLAQVEAEEQTPVLRAFANALAASPDSSAERFLVLRDRARYLDPAGKSTTGKSDWLALVELLAQQPDGIRPTWQRQLDFSDLARCALVAAPAGLSPLAADLWKERTAAPIWRGLPVESCLRDLGHWAECVLASESPELAQEWLEFQDRALASVGEAEDPDAGANVSPEGVLQLGGDEWAAWQERVAELRRAQRQWKQSSQDASAPARLPETPPADAPGGKDGFQGPGDGD